MTESDGYDGEVALSVGDQPELMAHAALAARFDPLAGRLVWSGRVAADVEPRAEIVVRTPYGSARATAVERDVWGNTRISGVDRPPFPVDLLDAVHERAHSDPVDRRS